SVLEASGMILPLKEIARICREAEHEWVHVPCGIMDHFACLLGQLNEIMLIDCRSRRVRHIHWPDDKFEIYVVDSKSPHRLSAGRYAERVRECQTALQRIDHSELNEFPDSLREIPLGRLESMASYMEGTIYRRALHVLTEIERVKEAVHAIETTDFQKLGELM